MEFDNHENRGPLLIGVFSAGVGVATILDALALWIIIKVLQKTGWEDWLIFGLFVRDLSLVMDSFISPNKSCFH